MKKILLATLIFFFTCQICLAESSGEELNNIFTNDPQTNMELRGYLEYDEAPSDTIYLEKNEEPEQNAIQLIDSVYKNNLNIKAPQKIGSKSLIPSKIKQIPMFVNRDLDAASKFSTPEYSIAPISSSYSTKAGSVSFGTSYDSSLSGARSNYSTGVFTRYDGKHFALTSGLSKSTSDGFGSFSDKINFAPELKITKRLSLIDRVETDAGRINQSNEIILRYKPNLKKHADEVQLELGAGQSYYENTYTNSSVRFNTRFKL